MKISLSLKDIVKYKVIGNVGPSYFPQWFTIEEYTEDGKVKFYSQPFEDTKLHREKPVDEFINMFPDEDTLWVSNDLTLDQIKAIIDAEIVEHIG